MPVRKDLSFSTRSSNKFNFCFTNISSQIEEMEEMETLEIVVLMDFSIHKIQKEIQTIVK